MTDPWEFGPGEERPPQGQPPLTPGYPPPHPPPPQGPYPGSYGDPAAPYGRHPLTGEPLSDKSKVVGGLLQLLGLIGVLGIGRIYIGQTGLGVAQLVLGIGITAVTCGFGFVVPVIWGIIDTIVIMTGNARDGFGRPLRDGT
jgi:TM2 domain-containing membrane protein YozV